MCIQNPTPGIDRYGMSLKGVAFLNETPNVGPGVSPHTEEVPFRWGRGLGHGATFSRQMICEISEDAVFSSCSGQVLGSKG
jgi:hypothetical protein